VREALQRAPDLSEWIEQGLLARNGWAGWRSSLALAHREPGALETRKRLAYDEIFANQLALLLLRQSQRYHRTTPLPGTGALTGRLRLPYELTGAQRRVIEEIRGDMAQSAPMLRLLQGDVGSGKTLVALLAMLGAVESGAQAALLVPTEILARQHYATLLKQLDSTGVRVAILTGREKGKARESLLMGLAAGTIHVLVGTHAIFQEKVAYKKLGLAVVDEQHRFGVSQRLLLASKAEHPPHLLVMTATPIPRTLTLTQYGEMDVSRIDEMPPGRTPVETRVMSDEKLPDLIEGVGRHIAGGGQAYWVCPLVEESEKSDAAAAEERARLLKLRFGEEKVGLVHGRMKGAEKDAVMEQFSSAALSVLVATTVIEVGVDVPNATLMIVEGAERFGLAQLHQLRGRVGRGTGKSSCILVRAQFGGSDQWGNIVNGIELARRIDGADLFGVTTPLITTADGSKMGKTAQGAVWLDENLLSPYDYWQFWRNTQDADVGRFLRLFTDLPIAEIARLERLEGAEINQAKIVLATQATAMLHGQAAAAAAEQTARDTFVGGGTGDDLPTISLGSGMNIAHALTALGFTPSNKEAKRKVVEGAVRLDDVTVSDPGLMLTPGERPLKLSLGKKRHGLLLP
jgi:hypothetical protein